MEERLLFYRVDMDGADNVEAQQSQVGEVILGEGFVLGSS